ncbi:MAG: MbnP family protein [Bacteroidota bacterium]
MFKFILSVALVSISASLTAQNFVRTSFLFHNEGQPFALNETITAYNGIDYNIQSMAFYMSRVKITHDGGQITALDTNEVYYVNFNVPEIILGNFNISQVEAITFEVGVPEYLNHLDISLYPEHHALSFHDPSMHWGWASGYMHMVMNGKGDNNGDGTPTTAYELNCLGDGNVPTAAITTTATVNQDNSRTIFLICNVDQWLRGTDPATTGAVHGSDGVNITVMNNVENYPVFESPATASLTDKEQITISVSQSAAGTAISWTDSHVANYRLLDADGRVLEQGGSNEQSLLFTELSSGLHFVQLFNDKSGLIGTAKWIVP